MPVYHGPMAHALTPMESMHIAGVACPKCYRPLDDVHGATGCEVSGNDFWISEEDAMADVVATLGLGTIQVWAGAQLPDDARGD